MSHHKIKRAILTPEFVPSTLKPSVTSHLLLRQCPSGHAPPPLPTVPKHYNVDGYGRKGIYKRRDLSLVLAW